MKIIRYRIFQIVEMIIWYCLTRSLSINEQKTTKNVFFSEIVTSLTTIKVNCMLSLALRNKYKVFVLFKKKSLFYEFFYKCIGIKNFLYLSENSGVKFKNQININRNSEEFYKNLLDYSHESIRVGNFVVSRILMEDGKGSFDYKKVEKDRIDSLLNESIAGIKKFKKMIDKHKCDLVVFNEKGYSPSGEVFETALKKKIRCIQWIGSPIENHQVFKGYEWSNRKSHPLALSNKTFTKFKKLEKKYNFSKKIILHLENQYRKCKWFNRQNLQKNKKVISGNLFRKKLKIPKNKKVCTVFTHIFDDATFFYGNSLFNSYEDWLRNILIRIKKIDSILWIIKIHPANILKSRRISLEEKLINSLFDKIPNNIRIIKPDSEINTLSFFQNTDYGLTVRGTVGSELACFGIPVLTAGSGRYSGEGFTIDPKNKKEFYSYLLNLEKIKKLNKRQVQSARIYTYASLLGRSIPMDGINIKYNERKHFFQFSNSDLVDIPKNYFSLMERSDIQQFLNWLDGDILEDMVNLKFMNN